MNISIIEIRIHRFNRFKTKRVFKHLMNLQTLLIF